MDFELSDEQMLLRESLTRFLENRYDFEARRNIIRSEPGWSTEIWRALAQEIGVTGITAPEATGGFNGSGVEIMLLMETLGTALVVEPVLETAIIGTGLLKHGGGERANALLEGIVAGDTRTSFACLEPGIRTAGSAYQTTAKRSGNGWILNGEKIVCLGAPQATHILVAARALDENSAERGVSIFAIDNDPSRLQRRDYRTIDDRHASDIAFREIHVDGAALIGAEGDASAIIDYVIDEATLAVGAEAVGAMSKALENTVDYAKQRTQFGNAIGQFQVLQHRMVDMHLELELARSAVIRAALSLDEDERVRAKTVSAAKKTVNDAARFIGQAAVQIHGAMGMTDELAIGHFFKRLSAIENSFGSGDYHAARYTACEKAA